MMCARCLVEVYGVWDPKITAIPTHQLQICQLTACMAINSQSGACSARSNARGFVFSVTRGTLVTEGHVMDSIHSTEI